MIEQARARNVFADLRVADVCATGLPAASYDLVTTSLVDEHLAELGPLYSEAARLARSDAAYVLVGFHPFFIMKTACRRTSMRPMASHSRSRPTSI